MRRNAKKLSWALILFLLSANALGVETHTKLWTSAVITGPLVANTPYRYYIQPDLRFVDNSYKFNEAILWVGAGYAFHPGLVLYLGDATMTRLGFNCDYSHFNIPWQQLSSLVYESPRWDLTNRLRLQEVYELGQASWAILLRERLLLRIPIQNWPHHAYMIFDEVFFGLKRPSWLQSNSLINQNRIFFGIDTQLSKEASFSVGYLNQYRIGNTNQMSNILLLQLSIQTG
jgi:hypothetical protein